MGLNKESGNKNLLADLFGKKSNKNSLDGISNAEKLTMALFMNHKMVHNDDAGIADFSKGIREKFTNECLSIKQDYELYFEVRQFIIMLCVHMVFFCFLGPMIALPSLMFKGGFQLIRNLVFFNPNNIIFYSQMMAYMSSMCLLIGTIGCNTDYLLECETNVFDMPFIITAIIAVVLRSCIIGSKYATWNKANYDNMFSGNCNEF